MVPQLLAFNELSLSKGEEIKHVMKHALDFTSGPFLLHISLIRVQMKGWKQPKILGKLSLPFFSQWVNGEKVMINLQGPKPKESEPREVRQYVSA